MKATEYRAEIFNKNSEKYTRFVIGIKANKPLLESMIKAFGGQLVKQTKLVKHYEVKGDKLNLMIIC